jgi:phenylpropionate dioxygenase-like ring-hydroxylating dioxygenase large terminal subunit
MAPRKTISLSDLPHVSRGAPGGRVVSPLLVGSGDRRRTARHSQSVKILGEELVLFRDENGDVGLIGAHCPHRGASLEYGDIEDGGIRCPYHGWLFDVRGRCLAMPGEPAGRNFTSKVRHLAYPVREQGGILFAYMGPGSDDPPPLPRYQALVDSAGQRSLEATRVFNYNWFNFIENGADPVHFSILHRADPNDGTWRSWFF